MNEWRREAAGPVMRRSVWGSATEMVGLRPSAEREREERIVLIATLFQRRRRHRIGLLRPQGDPEGGPR